MRTRLGLASGFLLISAAASAVPPRHHWRIYRADPDLKVEICYPADLLHVHHNKKNEGVIDLMGAENAEVVVEARPDKHTTLQAQLRYSLGWATEPAPRFLHIVGNSTAVREDDTPPLRVTSSIVRSNMYIYIAENENRVEYEFSYHVDHAFKGITVIYPKSSASDWKGVPEHMRSCFKSLGPITNPLLW